MKLRCAIVDDEPLALSLLESYVNKTPFLELAGKYSSAVQAACPWYPPTDFRGFPYSDPEQCAASPESLLMGKNVMRHPEEALACCPVSFVTKAAPPFLIIHGEDDHTVPFGQGEELHDELEKAGCDVTLLSIEDADHADLRFFQKEVWDEICAFFRAKL